MKIKVYTDKAYIPKGSTHIAMLYPFWGQTSFEKDPTKELQSGRFNCYTETGQNFLELTPLEDADIAVLPIAWSGVEKNKDGRDLATQLAQKVTQLGKKIMVFVTGGEDVHVWLNNSLVFDMALYRSRQERHTFAMPAFVEDLIQKHYSGELVIRQKSTRPTIGFCGYAPPLGLPLGFKKTKESIRLLANITQVNRLFPFIKMSQIGHAYRARALQPLLKNSSVSTNFLLRDLVSFGGAWNGLVPGGRVDRAEQFRKEFVNNMIDSDYILCVRGYDNFSLRLYETLCCGRIPIFLDTDCVLPYDFAVNWKDYCVWVNENEISQIAKKVINFHQRLSPQDFIDFQYKCREFWLNWLSPQGFFKNFYRHLMQVR
jgi:hypothetical protein